MSKENENKQQNFNTTEISEEETRYLEQTALLGLEYVLSDFAKQFQKSARRWELMAYPAMVVFGLLAISGFWLIYSLTKDMDRMSNAIDPNMAANLGEMSKNISDLNRSIGNMNEQITLMTKYVSDMNNQLTEMNTTVTGMGQDIGYMGPMMLNIAEMNQSMKSMTVTTGIMSRDVNRMSRPLRIFNNMVP